MNKINLINVIEKYVKFVKINDIDDIEDISEYCFKKNIFVNSNGIIFLSTEHSNEVVEVIISGIIDLTPLLKT